MASWETNAKFRPREVSNFSMSLASNRGDVRNRVALFQTEGDSRAKQQAANPFSDKCSAHQSLHKKTDATYGKPPEGSKTEMRGKQAGNRVSTEIIQVCQVISDMGTPCTDGYFRIKFGDLFNIYTKISNKLVGMLLRARKQGLLEFHGEMLFQRRDDDVVITLLKLPAEIEQINLNYQDFS